MTKSPTDGLAGLAIWLEQQRCLLGAVDGYDYRSGEEYGLRRAQLEAERRSRPPVSAGLASDATELHRAANAVLNNLWQTVVTGTRTHEENWEVFERRYPGVKWLHDSLALNAAAPFAGEPVAWRYQIAIGGRLSWLYATNRYAAPDNAEPLYAHPAEQEPGWKLVPVEPTNKMLFKAQLQYAGYGEDPPPAETLSAVWAAMLSASPKYGEE